ncbi:hypothetical protein Arub01_42060 [Actinomadura rubrobrunea]|uniref:Uncharacterized protein n=1 Tax=Actinomadura rubrobrunea TaxID=115335 RepID=A0A9W6PY59_9ACTN|nr:hypothetical protein Arub01_42060 [Actinomadura rubrobrunea]
MPVVLKRDADQPRARGALRSHPVGSRRRGARARGTAHSGSYVAVESRPRRCPGIRDPEPKQNGT